jgi:cytochrome c-type protein NapB
MKTLALMCALLTLSLHAVAADTGLTEEQMGLSRTSVTTDPDPATFEYSQADPYSGGVLPRAFNGAPPQIPHSLDGLMPITRDSNTCVSCHQLPDQVGKQKIKGEPTALPATHYTNVKNNALSMKRYNCTQCHTPQAKVNDLVGNTSNRK